MLIYVAVGKRGIAETRMYNNCPFNVVYDSLENQTLDKKLDIKILSEQKYILEINGKTEF